MLCLSDFELHSHSSRWVPLTIVKKGTGVRRVSTQKYHDIVTLEVMEFIQTSMTTEVVNIVVSISTNFYDLCRESDTHQISPCNISALSNRVVMRIKDMITQYEFA